jgi:hypothetical protein
MHHRNGTNFVLSRNESVSVGHYEYVSVLKQNGCNGKRIVTGGGRPQPVVVVPAILMCPPSLTLLSQRRFTASCLLGDATVLRYCGIAVFA